MRDLFAVAVLFGFPAVTALAGLLLYRLLQVRE